MTLITFANVIARYVFNSNILWALELTVYLFAWMVLIGASYCVKHSLHLGVDILLGALPKRRPQDRHLDRGLCLPGFLALGPERILGLLDCLRHKARLLGNQ